MGLREVKKRYDQTLAQIYQKPISKRTIIKGLRLGRGEGLRLRGQGSPP